MKRLAISLSLSALALAAGPVAAQAQAQAQGGTDAILVFDASGSMWGQINGSHKITIARDVVTKLLDDLPADRRIGLMAYGHSRKGDCADIEMLAPVGTDREAIRKAVKGLNPKGMTPMTAAVQKAAEQLKFTENKATVILVSDGEETCQSNPCDAVAALEKLGVDLTVHTVGFGLESGEAKNARAQLQCMAQATGGQFFNADNAEELADALNKVAVPAPAAAPVAIKTQLEATDEKGGGVIKTGLTWTVSEADTGKVIHEAPDSGVLALDLAPGVKKVKVVRGADGATAEASFNPSEQATLTLPIVVTREAQLVAPKTGVAGAKVQVAWEGPGEKDDYISVEKPGDKVALLSHITYSYTKEGSPLQLLMPPEPGQYEIRYIRRKTLTALASQPIEVTPVQASLKAPATAAAGATIQVEWTGPAYGEKGNGDYLSVEKPGDQPTSSSAINYSYVHTGSPLDLLMPPDAGTYEIRYIQNHGLKVLAQHTITLTPVQASLKLPTTAVAGSDVRVEWTGPGYGKKGDGDYISVEQPGSEAGVSSTLTYTYTGEGNPLQLTMPDQPGTYEVRYIQDQGYRVLARQTITVTAKP